MKRGERESEERYRERWGEEGKKEITKTRLSLVYMVGCSTVVAHTQKHLSDHKLRNLICNNYGFLKFTAANHTLL